MKWQMRKIVLLAVIVSSLFFSMLVYYVTYPFLFQNKAFFLSNFCLFQLEKHMKELSFIRIIIAGFLLLTVFIVCKRMWRQFFDTKRLQKVLIPFVRKLSCQKGCFKLFQLKKWMRLFFMKNIIKTIETH